MEKLREAAGKRGHSHWAMPQDKGGEYNSQPQGTGFFCDGGIYASSYGRFFLKWYADVLIEHGHRVLTIANLAFEGVKITRSWRGSPESLGWLRLGNQ